MGAALFVLVPDVRPGTDAMSRVAGRDCRIGFLGAGTILKNRDGDEGQCQGSITAAGLWMTAAIGVAAGLGRGDGVTQYVVGAGSVCVMPGIAKLIDKDHHEIVPRSHG